MRRLFIGFAMAVMVTARPELYREKEDFQFSRSSSDEGTKSGYYDAQRGNMGGNYERAHNMDSLAQHQMGGLMKQVQGELGDGSHTRTGNVFTSANSQGVFGTGHYDLGSLGNRNFREGSTYEDSQSQSSSANRAYESHSSLSRHNNAQYSANSQSHNTGFGGYQAGNLQEGQNLYGGSEYQHGSQTGRSSRFYTQSGTGYQGRNEFDHSNLNQQASSDFGADSLNRQSQVRIVLRPGSRVVLPINTQATTGTRTTSYYNQNTENSEAEALNSGDQQQVYSTNTKPKHYESSYSYHKQWEKQDVKPSITYQTPANSELYDSSRLSHGSQYENTALSSRALHHADSYTQQHSALSQSSNQAGFNTQQQKVSSNQLRNLGDFSAQQHSSLGTANSNSYTQSAYNSDANAQSANLVGAISSKPKSYQSSYSYHKSWERQGDPYVIKPASYDTQTSQRLTDLSNQYSSQNYGSSKSHRSYSLGDCVIECDPTHSHVRVARSASDYEEQNQNTYNDEEIQQLVASWQNTDLRQQAQKKWDNLEDLGQQTQNNFEKQEDLGQQTQDRWDNLQDLGQQTQHFGKLEDLGQQIQEFGQPSQEFGQETQNFGKLEDLGQQTQNKWDNLDDLGQQTQEFGQQTQDLGQQSQDFGQQTQDFGQETQHLGQELQDFGQQTQELGQQTQDLHEFGQNTRDFEQNENQFTVGQETQNRWNTLEGFGQQAESLNEQNPVNGDNAEKAVPSEQEEIEDLGQQTQTKWNALDEQNTENQYTDEGTHMITDLHLNQKFDNKNFEQNSDSYLFENPLETQGIHSKFPKYSEDSFNIHAPVSSKTDNSDEEKPLHSLWDKIDSLNDDFTVPMKKKDMDTYNDNNDDLHTLFSQSSYKDSQEEPLLQSSSSAISPKPNDHDHDLNKHTIEKTVTSTEKNVNQFTDQFTLEKEFQKTTTDYSIIPNDLRTTTTEKVHNKRPKDIGRGDIGPEDAFDDLHTTGPEINDNSNLTSDTNQNSIEKLSKTPKSDVTNTQNFPTLPNLHNVDVEKIPKDQFVAHNSQQESDTSNHDFFQHEFKESEHQNTEVGDFIHNSEDRERENPSHHEKEFNYFNHNNFQQEFQQHNTHFVAFGQQSENEKQNHDNDFHQREHVFQNEDTHNIDQSNTDTEQQITQSHSNGWESHHKFQQEQVFDYSHQQSLQEHHGFHQDHGFSHPHDFPPHGFSSHDDFPPNGFPSHGFPPNGFPSHDFPSHGIHPHVFHKFFPHHELNTFEHHKSEFGDKPDWKLHPSFDHHVPQDQDQEQQSTQKEHFESFQHENHYSHEQKFDHFDDQHQNEQWNVEQQNTDQILDDFSQQNQETQSFNQNFEQQNVNNFHEFGQKEKSSEFDVIPVEIPKEPKSTEFVDLDNVPLEANSLRKHTNDEKEALQSPHEIHDETQMILKKEAELTATNPHMDNTNTRPILPEAATEKPGFWKSVGNKFANAKNKVASWFGS